MAMQQNGHTSKVQARAVDYFYGRISRDEAESYLMTKGCQDGLYLLRESINVAGNYALSICYKGRIHHYSIELQPNGTVMIPEGRPFPGPIELINHHSKYLDGFLVKPKIPCSRPKNTAPMAWPGVTMLELEEMLLSEAQNQKLDHVGLKNVFGPQRQKFMQLVAAKLHEEQPWYHDLINRETAENNISSSKHIDGKFLVRKRDDKVSFALSLSYHSTTKHYKIDKRRLADGESKLAIEDGPPFDNLMDMIAHYHNKMDGLLCKLTVFCSRPNYWKKTSNIFPVDSSDVISNPIYGGRVEMTGVNIEGWTMLDPREGDDDDTEPMLQITPPDKKVYDSVPRTDDVFNLKFNDLILHSELGCGNFGSVQLGNYKHRGQTIPVAVKTLKTSDIEAEKDLLKEAKLMAQLDNQYIVRMIGVCKSDKIMLVLELAALGPLNKYLKKSPRISMKDIQNLMYQVAQGMAYLESKLYVHRDLAARNVLLSNINHVKISDFGLSRAIGIGCNYYKANETGRWPLKWYAPECLYFFKFDSKSDVWSYGVTMWEATSYGNKPYKGMKGQAIIEMLDNDQRLEKPLDCPDHLYVLMHKCWQRKSEERPTFQEIVGMFRNFKT